MSSQPRFSDPAYKAWLRDTLALLYLKEGIENITDNVGSKFHEDLKLVLGGSACSSCSPADMVKDTRGWYMRCSLCNDWLQQIISNHGSKPLPNIHRDNTDPQLWPTDPWEVLKCYMGYGCQKIHSAKDADAQNILTLFKNCQRFGSCGQIGRMNLVKGLLKIRNSLFHSGDLKVDEPQLKRDMQTMLNFLVEVKPQSPVEFQAVTDALNKIIELINDNIDLSLASNKDLEVRALQEKQNALDRKQRKLQVTANTLQTDVRSLKRKHTTNTCQLNTTQAAVKKLRTVVGAVEATAKRTEGAVSELRTDLGTVKATAKTTEGAVQTLERKQADLEAQIQKVQSDQDQFKSFLQANNLEQDLSRLSTRIEQHDRRITNLEQQSQVQSDQDQFKSFLQANNLEQDLSRLSTRIEQHDRRITNLEQQSQKIPEGPHQVTENDITSLQSELINHYRGGQSLLVPNPVVDEALDLEKIYVRPDIKVLRETSNPRTGLKTVQDKSTVGSVPMCKNLFYTDQYQNKQIYVAGNAGVGKTVLCKYLVKLWCQKQSNPLSEEADRKVIAEFPLVFYISLRASSKHYTVVDMIDAQILKQIRGLSHLTAADILQKHRCLVIVDGLDEWTCPEDAEIPPEDAAIPKRDWNSNSVFLTTTRPWKLDVLRLKGLEIDKHIELCGLNEKMKHLLRRFAQNILTL